MLALRPSAGARRLRPPGRLAICSYPLTLAMPLRGVTGPRDFLDATRPGEYVLGAPATMAAAAARVGR